MKFSTKLPIHLNGKNYSLNLTTVTIFILGHGGNLAVADHASADISRLSNGTKNAQAPGSAIVATSLINDTSFDDWMVQWLRRVS